MTYEIARTGNLVSSVRTIPITYVQFFVPGISQVPSVQFQVLTYALRGIFTLLLQEEVIVPFLHGMHLVVFDT